MNYILKLILTITLIILFLTKITLSKQINIIILGDSLIAGYGLLEKDGFVKQLEKQIQYTNDKVTFMNGGVSGETSYGLKSRLNWLMEDNFDGVVIATGSNDALRGISTITIKNNIDFILSKLKSLKIPSMLIGMRAPENMGTQYVTSFNQIYPSLSKKYNTSFYPFFLLDVALKPKLNQKDMLHPNKDGVKKIVKNISPSILTFIESIKVND
jgi:acyl-CoA thioesterase-1